MRKEPYQEPVDRAEFQITEDVTLKPLYRYKRAARVLGREDYHFDRLADIAPYDLALGWGLMADEAKLQNAKIKIRQSNRFYFWRMPPEGIQVFSVAEVSRGSANTHIIPANSQIKDYIAENVQEGNVIYLAGYLVNVLGKQHQGTWRTSTVRSDVGAGACEILYVTKITHLDA